MTDTSQHIAPRKFTSRWWYLVALVLFLAGVAGGTAWIVFAVATTHPPLTLFPKPDHIMFGAPDPGRYCLVSDIDFSRVRNANPQTGLPEGLEIKVVDSQTGQPCPVSPSIGLPNDFNGQKVYPLCSFSALTSGFLEITVAGAPPECRLMVQRAHSDLLLSSLISGSILTVLGWLVGPTLAFIVLSRRQMVERLDYFRTVEIHDQKMRTLFKTSSRS